MSVREIDLGWSTAWKVVAGAVLLGGGGLASRWAEVTRIGLDVEKRWVGRELGRDPLHRGCVK